MSSAKYLVIGDVHGATDRLSAVVENVAADDFAGVFLVGDFAPFDGRRYYSALHIVQEELAKCLEILAPLQAACLWVPGNHDPRDLAGPGKCDRQSATTGSLSVYGIGGAGPDIFGFPYEWRDDEIDRLAIGPVDVLLSHAPPLDILDRTRTGIHAGSASIRRHALRSARVVLCGHVHESPGVAHLDNVLVLNPGALGLPYGAIQYGELVADEAGFTARHVRVAQGRAEEKWSSV